MQFNKEGDKVIEELKLRVVYANPAEKESGLTSSRSLKKGSDDLMVRWFCLRFFY